MKYNFDEVIDRKGTHAVKVERLPKGADKDSLCLLYTSDAADEL